ncbi:hypothetical protein FOL46_006438 [Perkinsus olseni]|uniref:Uncharacterized protein n=1 Tax=Perkinsus olseni TaxID=32597 RepID=A0A7J6LLN0_PEROL|nr:hypothetical protein FOL46_006438 [Perkinsus olseni]
MSVDARETSSTLRLILDPEILNRILSRLTGSRYQAAEVEPPVLYKEMEWFAGISSNITIPVCDPVIYELKFNLTTPPITEEWPRWVHQTNEWGILLPTKSFGDLVASVDTVRGSMGVQEFPS